MRAYTRHEIPEGIAGTQETVAHIANLIREGRADPYVIETARQVVRHVPERDGPGEVTALTAFVRSHIRYVRDPWQVETLTTARHLLSRHRAGDCDDHVILLGAMVQAVGYPVHLVVGGYKKDRGEYSHIWIHVGIPGMGWVPVDPIVKDKPVGWESPAEHKAILPV